MVVDGSKFKAVNNRDRNFTHAKMARRVAQIEESITRYLHQLDSADRQEPSEAITTKVVRLKEKIGRLRQEMERLAALDGLMRQTPDQQISLTDPDSRSMATSGRGSGVVGYNVQVVVEAEHHLIVTHEVTNVGNDRAQLAPMAKAAKQVLDTEQLHVIADRGYFDSDQIKECVDAGLTVTLPKPQTSGAKADGRFGKQDFAYLPEQDAYRCPAGAILTYHYSNVENGMELRRYWSTAACLACPIKRQCTPAKERRVTRWVHEHLIEEVQQQARCQPRSDARQARDGRASLRDHQGEDGGDPLPDEAPAQRRRRDGITRARLQPDPGDEHHRSARPDRDPQGRMRDHSHPHRPRQRSETRLLPPLEPSGAQLGGKNRITGTLSAC